MKRYICVVHHILEIKKKKNVKSLKQVKMFHETRHSVLALKKQYIQNLLVN